MSANLNIRQEVVTGTTDSITIGNGSAGAENAISTAFRESDDTAHLAEDRLLHECEHRGYFICVDARI
jgi:hypothetical protein